MGFNRWSERRKERLCGADIEEEKEGGDGMVNVGAWIGLN